MNLEDKLSLICLIIISIESFIVYIDEEWFMKPILILVIMLWMFLFMIEGVQIDIQMKKT